MNGGSSMKMVRLFLFVALSVVVTSGGSSADDHTYTDHGDSSSVHEGGWYCAICELDFVHTTRHG